MAQVSCRNCDQVIDIPGPQLNTPYYCPDKLRCRKAAELAKKGWRVTLLPGNLRRPGKGSPTLVAAVDKDEPDLLLMLELDPVEHEGIVDDFLSPDPVVNVAFKKPPRIIAADKKPGPIPT